MKKDWGECGQLQIPCECSQYLGSLTLVWQDFSRRKFARGRWEDHQTRVSHHCALDMIRQELNFCPAGPSPVSAAEHLSSPFQPYFWAMHMCHGHVECTTLSSMAGAASQRHRVGHHLHLHPKGRGHPMREGPMQGQGFAAASSQWHGNVNVCKEQSFLGCGFCLLLFLV